MKSRSCAEGERDSSVLLRLKFTPQFALMCVVSLALYSGVKYTLVHVVNKIESLW